jgi:hypothetical protein
MLQYNGAKWSDRRHNGLGMGVLWEPPNPALNFCPFITKIDGGTSRASADLNRESTASEIRETSGTSYAWPASATRTDGVSRGTEHNKQDPLGHDSVMLCCSRLASFVLNTCGARDKSQISSVLQHTWRRNLMARDTYLSWARPVRWKNEQITLKHECAGSVQQRFAFIPSAAQHLSLTVG